MWSSLISFSMPVYPGAATTLDSCSRRFAPEQKRARPPERRSRLSSGRRARRLTVGFRFARATSISSARRSHLGVRAQRRRDSRAMGRAGLGRAWPVVDGAAVSDGRWCRMTTRWFSGASGLRSGRRLGFPRSVRGGPPADRVQRGGSARRAPPRSLADHVSRCEGC